MVINVIFKNESGFYKGDVYPLPYFYNKEDIENYICAVCDEHTELFMWYGDDGIVYECITKGEYYE